MMIHCPNCHSMAVESVASIQDEPRVDNFICEECGEIFEYLFPHDYTGDELDEEDEDGPPDYPQRSYGF